MGFGSIFGSLGRAIKRPFKDVHKAVMGSGRFMNRGFGKMTGGINKTGRAITGRGQGKSDMMEPAMASTGGTAKSSLLKDFAGKMKSNEPPKVTGSLGKKKGEWKGSKYIGPK
jgi:hypothetical protein